MAKSKWKDDKSQSWRRRSKFWSEYIVDWDEENNTGFPFVRGAHIEKEGEVVA